MPSNTDSGPFNKERASSTELRSKGRVAPADASGHEVIREGAAKKQEGTSNDDQRRNLYILGIPHHMTLDELKELFGRFGGVQHAVILAVLDAFRRRRGFVVMNSNAEAAAAMKGMSGSVVLGHKFHVSWAVVQRSNGFLDGVDRSVSAAPSASPGSPQWSPSVSPPAASRYDRSRPMKIPPALSLSASKNNNELSNHQNHSTTLILRNLHREIFKNASDVLPLLEPFGAVRRIRLVIPTSKNIETHDAPTPTHKTQNLPSPGTTPTEERPATPNADTTDASTSAEQENMHLGAVVEFSNTFEVSAASNALDGQEYGSVRIKAERPPQSLPRSPRDDDELAGSMGPGLEPLADDDIDYLRRDRAHSKKRPSNSPSLPGSPYFGSFGSPYLGSPNMFGFSNGFPANASPWMSSYSSSAPPSPAQLASFYYAQENGPDPYTATNRFASFPYPYANDYRYQESRPFAPRTYSQQY